MAISDVVAHIDAEIAKLQQAKSMLTEGEAPKGKRGRPKGSKNAASSAIEAALPTKAKRQLTPKGRKAIADAVRRRWAASRKQ